MRQFLGLLFLCIAMPLFAYQWPLAGGFLTASFGEDNSDSFLKGIRISGHGSVVSPFLAGELIYYSNESDSPFPVMGNVQVLSHDNGFRSIYSHLENGRSEKGKIKLDESDQLGLVGNSGKSYEKSLFFMIYDTKMDQYVNPLILLPPSGDTRAPDIEGIYLVNGEGAVKLDGDNRFKPGKFDVYGEIVDSADNSSDSVKTVPYSISLFYLGNEINQIKFDTLKKEKDKLILKGGNPVTFDDLYRDGKIYLGQLNLFKGLAYLEISASDISGNSRTKTYRLDIE